MARNADLSRVYAEIAKTEKQDDGTLRVWGKATGPDLDSDKQICDPEWLASAMPDWFKFGNIREQHSTIAAGTAVELEQDGTSWNIEAHVVDAGSVKKIEANVLKGFSVGIAAPKIVKDFAAPGGRIVGGQIVEVSLVDRPANPTCLLSLAKSVDGVLTKDETMNVDGSGLDGDEGEEVDLVANARAAILALLAGETVELVDGTGTTGPVSILLGLLGDLDWFENADAYDDMNAALTAVKSALANPTEEVEMLNLTTIANLTKAAGADDAADDVKAELADVRKSLGILTGAEIAALIETEVTKATAPLKESMTALGDEVVKVGDTVLNNGPTRVRTQADAAKASATDAALAEVARWEAAAEAIEDPILRAGYIAKAATVRATITKE